MINSPSFSRLAFKSISIMFDCSISGTSIKVTVNDLHDDLSHVSFFNLFKQSKRLPFPNRSHYSLIRNCVIYVFWERKKNLRRCFFNVFCQCALPKVVNQWNGTTDGKHCMLLFVLQLCRGNLKRESGWMFCTLIHLHIAIHIKYLLSKKDRKTKKMCSIRQEFVSTQIFQFYFLSSMNHNKAIVKCAFVFTNQFFFLSPAWRKTTRLTGVCMNEWNLKSCTHYGVKITSKEIP